MATVASTTAAAATAATNPNASPRQRAQQRLGRLVASLEAVASRLDADSTSRVERTVLQIRSNDLRRRVNRLDGIVAGEGLETRGQAPLGSKAAAPARPQTEVDRVEIAAANVEAAAASTRAEPTMTKSPPVDGIDFTV